MESAHTGQGRMEIVVKGLHPPANKNQVDDDTHCHMVVTVMKATVKLEASHYIAHACDEKLIPCCNVNAVGNKTSF